jgi:hypothetical protein
VSAWRSSVGVRELFHRVSALRAAALCACTRLAAFGREHGGTLWRLVRADRLPELRSGSFLRRSLAVVYGRRSAEFERSTPSPCVYLRVCVQSAVELTDSSSNTDLDESKVMNDYERAVWGVYFERDELLKEGELHEDDPDEEFFFLMAQQHNGSPCRCDLPPRSNLFDDAQPDVQPQVTQVTTVQPKASPKPTAQRKARRKAKAKPKAHPEAQRKAKAKPKPKPKPKHKARRKAEPGPKTSEPSQPLIDSFFSTAVVWGKFGGHATDEVVDSTRSISQFRKKHAELAKSGGIPWKLFKQAFRHLMGATVYMDHSTIGPEAGFGLFAAVDIEAGQFISMIRQHNYKDFGKKYDFFNPANSGPELHGECVCACWFTLTFH